MARPDVGQVVSWYICTVVACAFLATRLVVRWQQLKRFYLDDLFVILATLCLIGDLVIQHHMFNLGMSDIVNASLDEMVNLRKMIFPGSTLYITSLWLIKAGMVLFYKRIADRTRYQTIYNITLAILGATWLVLFFDIVFKCYPPKRQWESITNPDLACDEKQTSINYWLTILLNILTDVFIICLPISQVARLKMPPKQKWAVISVFLLGGLVVITSIIRAIYSHRNEQMITCTVSMIETTIAIIASCLPVLRTLFFGSNSQSGTYPRQRGHEGSSSRGFHAGAHSPAHMQSNVSVSNSVPMPVGLGLGLNGTATGDDMSWYGSEDDLIKEESLDGPIGAGRDGDCN